MLGSAWYKTPRRSRKTRKPSGRHYSAPPRTVHPRPAFHACADVLTCVRSRTRDHTSSHAYAYVHTGAHTSLPAFTLFHPATHIPTHILTHTDTCLHTDMHIHPGPHTSWLALCIWSLSRGGPREFELEMPWSQALGQCPWELSMPLLLCPWAVG